MPRTWLAAGRGIRRVGTSLSTSFTAGVDLRTVAGRLGHAGGGATTLRVYAAWVGECDRRRRNPRQPLTSAKAGPMTGALETACPCEMSSTTYQLTDWLPPIAHRLLWPHLWLQALLVYVPI